MCHICKIPLHMQICTIRRREDNWQSGGSVGWWTHDVRSIPWECALLHFAASALKKGDAPVGGRSEN